MSIILKPWYTDNIILYSMISTGMPMVDTETSTTSCGKAVSEI